MKLSTHVMAYPQVKAYIHNPCQLSILRHYYYTSTLRPLLVRSLVESNYQDKLADNRFQLQSTFLSAPRSLPDHRSNVADMDMCNLQR